MTINSTKKRNEKMAEKVQLSEKAKSELSKRGINFERVPTWLTLENAVLIIVSALGTAALTALTVYIKEEF